MGVSPAFGPVAAAAAREKHLGKVRCSVRCGLTGVRCSLSDGQANQGRMMMTLAAQHVITASVNSQVWSIWLQGATQIVTTSVVLWKINCSKRFGMHRCRYRPKPVSKKRKKQAGRAKRISTG